MTSPPAPAPPTRSARGTLLFLCTGNLCRSPFLEHRLRRLLADDPPLRIASAGTRAVVGAGIDPPMGDALAAVGVDVRGFRSRQVSPAMIAEADLVVTATQQQRAEVARMLPAALNRVFLLRQAAAILAGLPGQPAAHLAGLPAQPAADLAELTGRMAAGRWLIRTTEADDMVDPLGREPEAYDRCVRQLDEAVSALARGLRSGLGRAS